MKKLLSIVFVVSSFALSLQAMDAGKKKPVVQPFKNCVKQSERLASFVGNGTGLEITAAKRAQFIRLFAVLRNELAPMLVAPESSDALEKAMGSKFDAAMAASSTVLGACSHCLSTFLQANPLDDASLIEKSEGLKALQQLRIFLLNEFCIEAHDQLPAKINLVLPDQFITKLREFTKIILRTMFDQIDSESIEYDSDFYTTAQGTLRLLEGSNVLEEWDLQPTALFPLCNKALALLKASAVASDQSIVSTSKCPCSPDSILMLSFVLTFVVAVWVMQFDFSSQA